MIDAAGPAAAEGGGLGVHAASMSTATAAIGIDAFMSSLLVYDRMSDLRANC
jgi:hypothetical protein